ncbi:penicillin-binding protein 1A [Mycetohabitans sp. B8]|uniref:penicillin-binding protein 1A n=1 Tax=Mycetohabitans sp. B8 TaxID=2841845 RepID=UPI001F40B34B|nr:transglycosylase domain-containing protein [Mycetohabitans sp. B8]
MLARVGPPAARLWRRARHPGRRELAWAAAAVPAAMALYVLVLVPFTPGIGDIRKAKVEQPAQVLSADGKLLAQFKPSNREWVALSDISPHVLDALIATEDHRFYQHHGLDWRRTAAAAAQTFSGDRQGGSTLTQQLARNLYPDEIGRAPTLTRKLKEAITALKIEAVYTKAEILETYLNTVPFLYNAYGIEMAARTYFDKSASKLDVLQSATLVGMLKGNSYYNPVINPERALQRRNTVLAQMAKYGKLTPHAYESLARRPLRLDFERQVEPPGPAPHFAQQLRKWLIAWADRHDYNIYSDGLVVRTTIDSRLQAMATQSVVLHGNQLQAIANAAWSTASACVSSHDFVQTFVRDTPDYRAALDAGLTSQQALKRLLADRGFMQALCDEKTRVQADFVAIDPRDGAIKAWVGSRDFNKDPFDHVQQARRQPGSTFKPFVYAAAFEQGARADDTIVDQPVSIALRGGETWRPADDVPPSGQPMTLRDALAYSRNRITAQLMQSVGPAKVVKLAQAMGVRDSMLNPVPSLALGTSPVTLKEMVSAYSTIADGGRYVQPMMVTRIEDRDGNVLAQFAPDAGKQVLPAEVAWTLLDVMRGVIDRGTGTAIRTRFGIRADVAGKTGTTQDNADGWFILMHPQLVAGAWVGFNDSRVTLRSDYWGQGAHSALPIVGDFYQRALHARLVDPRLRFASEPPPGLFQRSLAQVRAWLAQVFPAMHQAKPFAPPRRVPRRIEPFASDVAVLLPASGVAVDGASMGLPMRLPVSSTASVASASSAVSASVPPTSMPGSMPEVPVAPAESPAAASGAPGAAASVGSGGVAGRPATSPSPSSPEPAASRGVSSFGNELPWAPTPSPDAMDSDIAGPRAEEYPRASE